MQKMKRLIAIVLALLLLPVWGNADDAVRAAPLTISGTRSGMVRVYLSSLGSRTGLTVRIDGSYTAEGSQTMTLRRGDTVHVGFSTSTGHVTLTANGVSRDMGQKASLRRHETSGENGLRISEARMPANLYPGDLVLTAVKNGGGYRLYPIVHVFMEDYLTGVVPYEMGNGAPVEALKAQAVAARTYTLGRMDARTSISYDVVDTTNDQVYNGNSPSTTRCTEAVNATRGVVLMNGAAFTATYYTASNGGQTEAAKNVWGGSGTPYLGNKEDPFDVQNPLSPVRRTTVYHDFSAGSQSSALKSLLRAKAETMRPGAVIQTIDAITPRSPKYAGGRLYTKLDFTVTALVGQAKEQLTLTCDIFSELEGRLGMSINASKNELWTVENSAAGFVLCARRFGHGVGMSQRGAMQMGSLGYTYDQILGFYYPESRRVQYTFTRTILGAVTDSPGQVITTVETPAPVDGAGAYAMIRTGGNGERAAVRAGASDKAGTLLTLSEGTAVSVLAKGDAWTLIRAGEIAGYVPTTMLHITGDAPAKTDDHPTAVTRWAQVTGGSLNLRSAAAKNARVVSVMPDAEILPVLDTAEGWTKVQYNAAVGYAMTEFLTLLDAWPGESAPSRTEIARVVADSGSRVRLRAKASSSARVLAEIAVGDRVTILEDLGDWCRVEAGESEGFMMARFLARGEQSAAEAPAVPSVEQIPAELPAAYVPAYIRVNGSTVNLRAHANSDAKVLQKLPNGADVQVTRRGAKWCGVTFGGQSGFVMTRYLVFPLDEEDAA